ncbi:MAG: phospholipase D family protein [Gammaproteobacteria bacterium]|jgi:phosphatidylserine/phosphatidylglycerophosphate/cardiolipin synthase-like enzyme
MRKISLLLFLFSLWSTLCFGDIFSNDASYTVCFSPEGRCTQPIVTAIYNAKKEILVQAFSFTNFPIAKALVAAQKRGVDVEILLDKSAIVEPMYTVDYCRKHNLPIKIDYLPDIAHNKVMIIDDEITITGSFNFTKAADQKNTENLLLIHDKILAAKYKNNWQKRTKLSLTLLEYISKYNQH